jgi:GR25 family glycosyltransferase involved in LPS biosynthesis
MNFEHYWKPLLDTKPDNCIIWGERNDVDTFYAASDIFYFSSILELNPLSIKEALSYKLPSLFRRLHTYLDTYDSNRLVHYITNDLGDTKNRLLKLLGLETTKSVKPKIQIKHLLTRPDDEREMLSMKSISTLQRYGINYQPIVNQVYEGLAPAENCRRPEHISKDNKPGELYPGAGLGWMTGRHYGCYLAHRGALETMDSEYDYTLIFEADAYVHSTMDEFVDIIYKGCEMMERDDVYFLSFADNPSRYKERINEYFSKTGFNQDLAHAYIVKNKDKEWWMERLKDCGWDVGDLWYNHVFANHPKPRYTTNKVYSNQGAGYSLLDETIKKWEL